MNTMNVLFVYPNINGFHYDNYHFGLASIVSIVRQAEYNTKVLLITEKSEYSLLLNEIKSFDPQVVGFSSVSSQFHYVKEMVSLVKEVSPETITVCGGVHPTIYPDALLETNVLDCVFVGESEFSFVEFLDKIKNCEAYQETDNLAYARNGKLVRNKLKPLIENLEILPHPDKEVYPYEQASIRLGYAPFFFTRGCPYTCTYCSNHALANMYNRRRNYPRFRSPESCIQEIEEVIRRYGDRIQHVFIGDDIFGLNTRWRQEFCDKYKERVNVKFIIVMHVEMVNDELLNMLKDAGCFRLLFGVESGDEVQRNEVLDRRMSNEQIIRAFDLCRKHDLETISINIIGFPGETEEMIKRTVELNKRIRPTSSVVNIFYPYKGTKLGDKCFEEGLVDLGKFHDFTNERRESILKYSKKHRKMLMYYYNNWDILFDPFNVKLRLKKYLSQTRMLEHARTIKKAIERQRQFNL